jgi:hypothetical protein
MTAADLLHRLVTAGATVQALEPNRLRIEAPAGALTPALRSELAERKTELLALLRTQPTALPTTTVEADPGTRRAWADALCRQLSEAVAGATTPQVREWEPAWRVVEVPSRALLDALAEYEASGTDRARERAAELAELVLCAWRDAAAWWDAEAALLERWSIQHENDPGTCTPNGWDRL